MEGFTWQIVQYLLPELILAVIGFVLLLAGKNKSVHFFLAMGSLIAALISVIYLLGSNIVLIHGTVEINTFSLLLKMIFIVLGIFTIWGSKDFASRISHSKEYYAFIIFATIGLNMVGSAGDLITLFIAFELTSISTYALPLIDEQNEQGKEAGLKYFITGAFSSGLILFGMSLLFGMTGSVVLKDIAEALTQYSSQPLLITAFAFLIAGFGYKMTVVPFHLWAPDSYTGAPTPVSAFLAGTTKKGAFVVGLKIFLMALVVIKLKVSLLLGVFAVLTMTLGNAVALMQKDTKRMLAYSSVAHAGNILVGLAIYSQLAVAGSILHIIAHGIMTIGAFFGLLWVAEKRGGYELEKFSGLRKAAPWTAFGLFLLLLSLAGIPPFLGFWSKMIIVLSAFEIGGWYVYLALALVLNSALSLVYYARVIMVMYMENKYDTGKIEERGSYLTIVYVCAIVLLLVGFFPEQLVAISSEAARFIIP